MRTYHQLTSEERYALSKLRKQGYTVRGIARALGRAPSTISREVRRNSRKDGGYRHSTAHDFARWRRSRSRRNQRFGDDDWALVLTHLKNDWSPEQVAGRLREDGVLRISHESIYRHIWRDKRRGGTRFKLLRQTGKRRRKRYPPTTPGVASPENVTSPNAPQLSSLVRKSATGRSTPSSARPSTASSRSSSGRPDIS